MLKWKIKSFIKSFLDKIKNNDSLKFYLEKLSCLNFGEISFRRILSLIKDRTLSISSLVRNVFMKVIRKHNYSNLYKDERYNYRRISCLIKELTRDDYNRKNKWTPKKSVEINYENLSENLKGNYNEIIGLKIEQIVKTVSDFETTLWFTDENHNDQILRNLVVTGQLTMCFNLLDYLQKLCNTSDNGFGTLDKKIRDELLSVLLVVKKDWKNFKKDPLFLVDKCHTTLNI